MGQDAPQAAPSRERGIRGCKAVLPHANVLGGTAAGALGGVTPQGAAGVEDMIVADRGYSYYRSVVLAARWQAVVVRIAPTPFPLENNSGEPYNVLCWLHKGHNAKRAWHGWSCCIGSASG